MATPRLPALLLVAAVCVLCASPSPALAAVPSLSVSPSVIPSSRSPVAVSWSGVADPSPLDYVELYVVTEPEGAAPPAQVLLGYFNTSGAASGSHGPMVLFNPHGGGVLAKYVSAAANASVLAESNTAAYADPNEPTGVHLALTNTAGQMRVQWSTRDALSLQGQAVVQYGPAGDSLTFEAKAASYDSFAITDMCGAPANLSDHFIPPGAIQNAVMELAAHGLDGRRVYYRVGAPGSAAAGAAWSRVFSFVAAPPAGADVETALIVYGDMGTMLPLTTGEEQQPAAVKTAALVARDALGEWAGDRPVAVAHIGDISYSRGHSKYHLAFMQMIEPVAAQVPYHVSYGNHEYDFPESPEQGFFPWRPKAKWDNFGTDSGGECGVVMSRFYDMPKGYGDDVAYSFEVGNVHVALFSAEHNFLAGSAQYSWLAADLAAVNRSVTPWLLVGVHRPIYSSSMGHTLVADLPQGYLDDQLRAAIEPLLVKNAVDVFLAGHVHTYERSCKIVSNFECAADNSTDGTVHLLVGSGGNDYNPDWAPFQPGSPPSMNNQSDPNGRHHLQPEWSIFRTMNNGYSRFLTNATHLTMEYVGDQRGSVHDSLVLERKPMMYWN